MKRKIALLVILIICFSIISVYAIVNYGEFSYWYSDSTQIGYMPSTVKYQYKIINNCQMDINKVGTYVNNAISAWSSKVNVQFTSTTSTDYNLAFATISRTDATASNIPYNVPGFCAYTDTSLVGTGVYGSNNKYIYLNSKSTIYFVWDDIAMSNYKTSDYSDSKWNAIATHEYGHAAGYYGHNTTASSTNKSVMHPNLAVFFDQWNVTTPQTNDIRHIDNIY